MSATWFDHAIATVAPRMAARRVMARQAFETLTRGYDGAARGRRTEGWRAPGSSADTEIGMAGALLRDRMRDLVRNNPHAAKALAAFLAERQARAPRPLALICGMLNNKDAGGFFAALKDSQATVFTVGFDGEVIAVVDGTGESVPSSSFSPSGSVEASRFCVVS